MEKKELLFNDMLVADQYLWFIDCSMNALYRSDIKSLQPEFVLSFPNETNVRRNLYQTIVKCGDKIVFCPCFAREIAIFDIVSGKIEKICVDYGRYSWTIAAMYGGCAIGKKVFLFRRGYSEIYLLDTLSGKLSKSNIITQETNLGMEDYFWHWKVQKYKCEDEVIFYDKIHHILYQSNINTLETTKLASFNANQELVDFVSDGFCIWILCNNGRISKLDGDRIIDEYKCNINVDDDVCLYYCDNIIYVIEAETGRVVSLLEEKGAEKERISIPENNSKVRSLCIDGSRIVIQWQDGFFYYHDGVNVVSGILERDLSKIPVTAFFPKDIIRENKDYPLQKMLTHIGFWIQETKDIFTNEVGKEIYQNAILEKELKR